MAEQSPRVLHQSNPTRLRRPALLAEHQSQLARNDPPSGPRQIIRPAVRASFVEGVSGPLSLLEVELPLSWDATERLPRALFVLRLQVVSSERCYARERVVHRLRVVEFDGAPIRQTKRQKLTTALESLLDSALAETTP